MFLCGGRGGVDGFRGVSRGRSPRDIPRNLSAFLSFPHGNVVLFRFTGTRICILSPRCGGGVCVLSLWCGERNGFFILLPALRRGDAGSFPVVRGGNADSLLIYLFIRNGQFWVNLERISGDVDFIELEKMLNFN